MSSAVEFRRPKTTFAVAIEVVDTRRAFSCLIATLNGGNAAGSSGMLWEADGSRTVYQGSLSAT